MLNDIFNIYYAINFENLKMEMPKVYIKIQEGSNPRLLAIEEISYIFFGTSWLSYKANMTVMMLVFFHLFQDK